MTATTVKRRRSRRAAKNPLHGVVTQARKMRREMNKYLSEMVSHALGFAVEVKVKADPPMSPAMKRAARTPVRDYKRMLATLSQAPNPAPSAFRYLSSQNERCR